MSKILIMSIICSMLFSTNSFAFLNEDSEKIMAGIKFTKNHKPNIYLSVSKSVDNFADRDAINNQEVSYSLNYVPGENLFYPTLNITEANKNAARLIKPLSSSTKSGDLSYSGYKNVEGFENTSKKQDKTFAASVIGVVAIAVIGGLVAIVAVASAI